MMVDPSKGLDMLINMIDLSSALDKSDQRGQHVLRNRHIVWCGQHV